MHLNRKIFSDKDLRPWFYFQQELIENLSLPALFTNEDGTIEYISKSLQDIFKKTENEVIGQSAHDFFKNDDASIFRSKDRQVKKFLISIKDKSLVGYLTIIPCFFQDQDVSGSYIFFKDKTSEIKLKKQIEFEKKKSYLNDKLKSIGELAAGIGHEINNPLAIISGKIQKLKLLKRKEISDIGIFEDIEVIEESILRITKITESLKDLSLNKTKQELLEVEITDLLKKALTLIQGNFINKGIKIIQKFESLFKLNCDETKMAQVFFNLINNAFDEIKDQKESWIKIETLSDSQFNYINFTNSGNPINPEIKNHIFDPFFTTKPVGQGSGLGLGISLEIIQQYGGDLYLNEEKEYTTFTIRFLKQ